MLVTALVPLWHISRIELTFAHPAVFLPLAAALFRQYSDVEVTRVFLMPRKPHPVPTNASQQQLDQAETMLRKLLRAVEQSADMVVITDRNGIIEYANPAFEMLTGYSCEEVIGRTPRMLKSGEQPPEFYRELWQTILSPKRSRPDRSVML